MTRWNEGDEKKEEKQKGIKDWKYIPPKAYGQIASRGLLGSIMKIT